MNSAPVLWLLVTACSGATSSDPDGALVGAQSVAPFSSGPQLVDSPNPAPSGVAPIDGQPNPAASGSPEGSGGAPGVPDPSTPASGGETGEPPPPPAARPPLATRLSKPEYTNSIFDVLGVTLTDAERDAALGGIPDDQGDGVFKHFGDKQTTVEQHASAYLATAQAVADRVDMTALAAQYASCTEATLECARSMTAALGRRLFRRALTERELDTFETVTTAALDEGETFETAMRWTLMALLQAPPFLFHLEDETLGTPGTERARTGTELAARLASFLWLSVPDEELLAAAESGSLENPETLTNQVTRMLEDAKAQRLTEVFSRGFSRAEQASFEGATAELKEALAQSIIATFQYHFWEAKRSVAELFTTTEYMVNAEVATLLGVNHSGSGFELVDVSALPERRGVMTHPGTIAGMGDRAIGSFVNRGKYMLERILCRNPIAVPAALLGELEEFNQDTTGLNEHERAAIRMTRPECWGCHTQFEPLAFGFSRFDGAGRYLGEQDAEGKPLSLDGWVPISTEALSPRYTNVAEYMQILATNEMVQHCMTEHFLAFATARSTDEVAKAHAPLVGASYQASGSTLQAMVAAVVHSDLFGSLQTLPAPGAGDQP